MGSWRVEKKALSSGSLPAKTGALVRRSFSVQPRATASLIASDTALMSLTPSSVVESNRTSREYLPFWSGLDRWTKSRIAGNWV